jgi:hypothetical protein
MTQSGRAVNATSRAKNGNKGESMEKNKKRDSELPTNTPLMVSPQEWEAARQRLLVREKALTRARDGMAAERRQMPRMAVEKAYVFDGPKGKVSLLDMFEGRRQLIVYVRQYGIQAVVTGGASGEIFEESPDENRNHRRWRHGKDSCAPPRQAGSSRLDCELERT